MPAVIGPQTEQVGGKTTAATNKTEIMRMVEQGISAHGEARKGASHSIDQRSVES